MKTLGILCHRALLCVLLIVAANAYALRHELAGGRFELNDSVFHYTLADRTVQAIETGENPMDYWVSEWTFGYSVPRTYPILSHVALALLHLAMGKAVSVLTLFIWARYLLVALLPLTVYGSARLLTLQRPVAVASALVSPLIATNGLFGLEYGAYLWRGSGLFTQALAMHMLLVTVGCGFRAMRGLRGPVLVGVLLGFTFLAHFIYGFIGALSLVLLAFIPNTLPASKRFVRTAIAGFVSCAVAAVQLIPMLLDGPLINHSRWEPQWKWDSFGFSYVFENLVRGNLFDFGRLPVLSLLALLGAVVCVVRIRRSSLETSTDADSPSAAYAFALFGAVLWLLMFCGRPTWGVLFTILGAGNVHLHRLIGGLHTFGFFLMGIGLGSVWVWGVNKRFRGRYVLATLIGVAVLFPVFRERRIYLQKNAEWSQGNLAALISQEEHIDAAVSSLKTDSGRTYSGLAATWGNQFRVGSVPFHGILSVHHIPALSFLYHAMAQTSDLMVWFDELNPAHYRLFNVSAVVAPSTRSVPPFLHERSSTGDFRLYGAPANGYFDIVRVPYSVSVSEDDVYDVNLAWLKSDWPGRLNHLLLDADGRTGAGLPRLLDTQSLPEAGGAFDLGFVSGEKREGEIYEVAAELQQSGYLLFKMTYHPAWRAIVDGSPQSPVMLTPGFMGVALGPGRHLVRFQYQPGPLKALLIILALLIVFGAAVAERHRGLDWIDFAIDRAGRSIRETLNRGRLAWMPAGFGLLALSLPVCIPLLTSQLVSGHDAFSYAPRLVEFHENIHNGVVLPRWAPDLGNGGGQPLFLFTPPLIYYLAEIWYLLGCQTTTAYNLACVVIIVASAVFMRLLGQLYFGRAGGWLAAAAYIYSPYFHVDLYVRQALAEFAAFPFYPLTLYGFGRFARDRDRRFLLLGAIGLACVFLAHNAAALLFAPILLAFIVYNAWSARSLKLMLQLFGGAVLGVALSAFVWLPILMEMKDVHIDRFIEGYLKYSNHMVYVQQFFSTTWGFGLSWPGYGDGMSFSLGWPHVLMLVAAVAIWRKQQSERRGPVYLFTLLAVAYCFLMTPAALWLWERVSILQPVEFPWRLLGPVSVCVAMIVASLGNRMTRGTGLTLAMGSLIAMNLGHIGAERYYRLDAAASVPDQIARRGISATTREEYEPRTVHIRPPHQVGKLSAVSGDAKVYLLVRKPTSWTAAVNSSQESVLQANLFYFPGWTATVDGNETPIHVSPNTGEIQAHVPAGEHRLNLEFRRTAPRLCGEIISAVALVVLFATCCFDRGPFPNSKRSADPASIAGVTR